MTRLPTPGSDSGQWGDLLNEFLSQAHTADGKLKTDSVTAGQLAPGSVVTPAIADGAVTNSKLDTPTKASLAKADTGVQPGDLGDAATLDVGTAAGTVAAGDDSRITGALPAASLDTAAAALVDDAGTATGAALISTYAVKIPPFELVPATCIGDSYGPGGSGTDVDARTAFADRFCSRVRTQALSMLAASGKRSDEILLSQVTPLGANLRGLVIVADVVLNDINAAPAGGSEANTAAAFRTILARLTSRYIAGVTDTGVRYGPGWTAGASSTVGAYVDLSFDGDSCYILTDAVTGAGGTLEVKNTAGVTVKTIPTGNHKQAFTKAEKVSGFGAGAHHVRVTLTGGTASVLGMILPSDAPPLIIWHKPGSRGYGSTNDAAIASYLAACQSVADDFATVLPVGVDGRYDANAMLGPTHHLNDLGNAYVADTIMEAVFGDTDFAQGLNRLTRSTGGTPYTPTEPSYTSPGATTPSAPGSPTATAGNQVLLTAALPSDGGTTLTGYEWQAALAGSGSWASISTPTAVDGPSVTITTGLIPATSYDFRVRAINSIGNGAWSSTATATVGSPSATYSADTFTRPDSTSLGVTETGGFAWATYATSQYSILNNQLNALGAASPPIDCLIDDGHNDGTWSIDLSASGYGGIAFCIASNNSTGYVFYRNGTGTLTLAKRTAPNTYSTLYAGSASTAAITLSVVKNGSNITVKVNGATITTVSDASYAGPKCGAWAGSTATPKFDNWSHTSAGT